MEIEWVDGSVDMRCAVCGRLHAHQLLARVPVNWREAPIEIARCAQCGAVILSAVLPPSAYTEADWDWYIEQLAGLEAIADTLAATGAPRGRRMLDVGCGYGFALDVARFLYDWEGVGLDPSIVAARGRTELGLDIRPGTLDDAFEPDHRFDVIFSSEVIEHIAEPREFLAAARRRLSPDGILVLTTPDAAAVRPDTSGTMLHPVLSVGLHEFLVDAVGLDRLLREAGFVSKVWEIGASLRAVAALRAAPLASVRPDARVHLLELARYCDVRRAAAVPGSALALGMASRHLKYAVNERAFELAVARLPALRQALLDRHAIDLADPAAALNGANVPAVLAVIYYNLGLLKLLYQRAPKRAAVYFSAAAWVGKEVFDRCGLYPDPETAVVEALSRGNLALALAHFAPEEVEGVLAGLDAALQRGAGDSEMVASYRARVEAELALRRTRRGRAYRRARAVAGRVTRRVARRRRLSRVPKNPGVTPGRRWSGRRASTGGRGASSPSV